MSESDTVTTGHSRIPILTHDNYGDWEVAIISYLTNTADHVRVIERRADNKGTLIDLAHPTDADEAKKWDASEREALGVNMSQATS